MCMGQWGICIGVPIVEPLYAKYDATGHCMRSNRSHLPTIVASFQVDAKYDAVFIIKAAKYTTSTFKES